MARAEQIASKGGRLIPASKFIPSPPSIDPADNWVRPPAGLATEEERSLLQRAEKEGWVTHIVILDPRTPSSHDPAPATFDNVLAQLGPNGMTRESLGAFCKIVNTDWISASGDKMEPVSELGNELFNDERGGRVAVDEDSKKRVALQADWDNQREIARKLGMYLRMNGDEDSEGEEPDTPYDLLLVQLIRPETDDDFRQECLRRPGCYEAIPGRSLEEVGDRQSDGIEAGELRR